MALAMRRVACGLLFLAVACQVIATATPAWAEQPFFYYPAYGAQRGKIVYRDGPFVNRQKIRWGNGLTEYGAGVINNAIGAAVQILPAVIKEDPAAAEDAARSQAEFSRSMADEQVRMQQAQQLYSKTGALYTAFGLTPTPAAGGGSAGSFSDWDNSGLGGSPTQPVTPGTPPPPTPDPATAPGNLQDWDNSGTAPANPPQGGAGFDNWDNR
jgi:hypothetical protein